MKLTLSRAFGAGFVALVLLLAVLFALTMRSTRRSILESSDRLRAEASARISEHVRAYLGKAETALRDFEAELHSGAIRSGDPASVEAALLARLLANPELTEMTAILAKARGFDDDGDPILEEAGRQLISVHRDASGMLVTRWVRRESGKFTLFLRERGKPFHPVMSADPKDPTTHPTFEAPANEAALGQMIWSDLHFSELGEQLIRVSVQEGLVGADGKFVGVVRAGVDALQLDKVASLRLVDSGDDPHRVFICDDDGRLITRSSPGDRFVARGDDLRVAPAGLSAPVAHALREPSVKQARQGLASGRFALEGEDYLYTFRALGGTQDWIVGIVVPERFYLGGLLMARRHLIFATLAVILAIVAGGIFLLSAIRRGHRQITRETSRMNSFDFTPAASRSVFADVEDSLESLERAKTAMRAMGKYVPVDLVRLLYASKREPRLGAELVDVSLMFTDIKGFTTMSELLTPGRLAEALGRYLEAMVDVIHRECSGTIDKFIGDAIMTIWNSPTPLSGHASLACRAALDSRAASLRLFASAEWKGIPPFETRFGLHRERVMVGHFGAPDRMNFTAIGDGVNLAARLEGLNKQYGTAILASAAIHEEARAGFEFRLLDRVAVKGKKQGILVYELLERRGALAAGVAARRDAYELAFADYQARRFREALAGFEALAAGDPPSAAMAGRCREFLAVAPAPDWDGTFEAHEK